jgi:hypothetical protein
MSSEAHFRRHQRGRTGANQGELVEGSDGLLYGVTRRGGRNQDPIILSETETGTIFRMSPEGDAVFYEIVHHFAGHAGNGVFPEGILPAGGLTIGRDGNFYGTTFCLGAVMKRGGCDPRSSDASVRFLCPLALIR